VLVFGAFDHDSAHTKCIHDDNFRFCSIFSTN
jgi:hypothetical protein